MLLVRTQHAEIAPAGGVHSREMPLAVGKCLSHGLIGGD